MDFGGLSPMRLGHVARVAALALASALSTLLPGEAAAQEYKPPLTQIGVTSTTHNTANGSGVLVGILDTLADASHPELKGRLSTATYTGGVYSKPALHGTHVAGIIGAAANGTGMVGVAPKVSMLNVAVFDDRGWIADTNAAQALAYVKNAGATVVNMSYGPTAKGDLFLNGELAVVAAYNSSMVIARAAGNAGVNLGSEALPAGVSVAGLDHILIVGSVDANNKISSFSNKPGQACWGGLLGICSSSAKIMNSFIVAPGSSIYSTLPGGYGTLSGTSMATPHVAGAAALLQSLWPALKADPGAGAVIQKRTANDQGAMGELTI
jgi:subtilisin family serine protease